jgi:hypothetical protein
MDSKPATHTEPSFEDATDPAIDDTWVDEKTVRIDFERPTLSAEEKLVFGYLTMEQHGEFATLSFAEQQQFASTIKR